VYRKEKIYPFKGMDATSSPCRLRIVTTFNELEKKKKC